MGANILEDYADQLCFDDRKAIYRSSLLIHKILKDEYFLRAQDPKSQRSVEASHIHMLISNPRGIYELTSNRTVIEYEQFWAIGSGNRFALGAMQAIYNRYKDAETIAKMGIEAACAFDNACALPMKKYIVAQQNQKALIRQVK